MKKTKIEICRIAGLSYYWLFGNDTSSINTKYAEIMLLTSIYSNEKWFLCMNDGQKGFLISLVYKVGLSNFNRLKNTNLCLKEGLFEDALYNINDSTINTEISDSDMEKLLCYYEKWKEVNL